MNKPSNRKSKVRVTLHHGMYIKGNDVLESMVIAGYMSKGCLDIRFCKRSSRSINLERTHGLKDSYHEETPYVFSVEGDKTPVVINLIKEIKSRRPVTVCVQDAYGNLLDIVSIDSIPSINYTNPKKVEIINAFLGYKAFKIN